MRIVRCIVAFAMVVSLSSRLAAQALPSGTTADRIVVEKSKRTLSLYRAGKLLKSYKIALGKNPVGPKQREGDSRTPEGSYVIDFRKAEQVPSRPAHLLSKR